MGIAEEYERMEGWTHVVQAAGFECDGRPGTVYELATLIMNDTEVKRLRFALYDPIKAQARMDKKLAAILNDTPIPDEPFESDLVDALLSMSPQQREALQKSVIAKYQSQCRNTDL